MRFAANRERLEKYIPDPAVSVTILKVGSQRVYVIGKVTARRLWRALCRRPAGAQHGGGLAQFADSNEIRVMPRG
jgi:hypothetical protein